MWLSLASKSKTYENASVALKIIDMDSRTDIVRNIYKN